MTDTERIAQLEKENEALAKALQDAGGLVKLMDQIGLQWKHNDGSTVTLEGTKECLDKCNVALAEYAKRKQNGI